MNNIPNFHPLILHFPIVLACTALILDLAFLLCKKSWINSAIPWIYAGGILSIWLTYFSGKFAADSITITNNALGAVATHADRAWLATIFFTLIGSLRIILPRYLKEKERVLALIFFLGGSVAFGLVGWTADAGGALVYRYALAVSIPEPPLPAPQEIRGPEKEKLIPELSPPKFDALGVWSWKAKSQDFGLLQRALPSKNETVLVEKNIKAVEIHPGVDEAWFSFFPEELENVAMETVLDFSSFNGQFSIIYKYLDDKNYDALRWTNDQLALLRFSNGKESIIHKKPFQIKEENTYIVSAHGSHFRAQVNGELILHGHGKALPAGKVGFYAKGTGFVTLKRWKIQKLNEGKM